MTTNDERIARLLAHLEMAVRTAAEVLDDHARGVSVGRQHRGHLIRDLHTVCNTCEWLGSAIECILDPDVWQRAHALAAAMAEPAEADQPYYV